jgi:uncharacterized protein YjiS (DUF1127 family)
MTTLPLTARLTSSFSVLSRALKRRDVYRKLNEMDGHLLKDIGLTRHDVEAMRRAW